MKSFSTTIAVLLVCAASSQLMSGSRDSKLMSGSGESQEEDIHILAFIPSNKELLVWKQAAELAVEEVNKQTDILAGFSLQLTVANSGCFTESITAVNFVKTFFYSGKNFSGVVGPVCVPAGNVVAGITNRESIAILNFYMASHPPLTNCKKQRYSFVMDTLPHSYIKTLSCLVDVSRWKRVAVFYESSSHAYTLAYSIMLRDAALQKSIDFAATISDAKLSLLSVIDRHIRVVFVLCSLKLKMQILCLIVRVYPRQFKFPTRQFVFIGGVEEYTADSVTVFYNHHNYTCSRREVVDAANGFLFFFTNTTTQTTGRGILNHSGAALTTARAIRDGVWAFALALNNSIPELNRKMGLKLSEYSYGNRQATEIIREEVFKLNHTTPFWKISFNNQTSNTLSKISIYQQRRKTAVHLGYFSRDEDTSNTCTLESGEFIRDRFRMKHVFVHPALTTLITLGTLVILTLIVTSHITTVVHRRFPAIRASSYPLGHLTFLGCYIIAFSIINATVPVLFPLSLGSFKSMCLIHAWCLSVGLTLILGTTAAKTWRLYFIFIHMRKPGKLLSDWGLITLVLVLVAVDVAMCAVVTSHYEMFVDYKYTVEGETEFVQYECRAEKTHVSNTLFLICPSLMLATTVVLAILTRSIRLRSFKTNNVICLAYSLAITLSLGASTFTILKRSGASITVRYSVLAMMYISILVLCFQFQFFPPILLLLREKVFHKIPGLKKYSTSVNSKSYHPTTFRH